MFLAIVIFAVLIGIGILMLLGMLPNGVDVIKFVTPQHSGIAIPDVQHAILLVVLIVVSLLIAYVIHRHYHSQEYAISQYVRNKALYDQYVQTMKARLARIAAMYYHFD